MRSTRCQEQPTKGRIVTFGLRASRTLPNYHIGSWTGIPADKLKEVFEPFFTTKTEGNGHGVVDRTTIVEAHDGKIFAMNEPGAEPRSGLDCRSLTKLLAPAQPALG